MSTEDGIALPSRTSSVKSDSKLPCAPLAASAEASAVRRRSCCCREVSVGLGGVVALRSQKEEPVRNHQEQRKGEKKNLPVAIGHAAHDPPPSDAGTRVAPRGASFAGGVGLKVTVMLNL